MIMKKIKGLSLLTTSILLTGHVAYADFGDAVVGGVVGGAVGSVITNEIYNKKETKQQPQQKATTSQKTYYAPQVRTDEKRIQIALQSLGFYRGRIDGQVNSYETRSAIREMNTAYEIGQTASLKPEAKDTLIFLGTLFEFDRHLIASSNDRRTRNKKIQTALKIHGYYSGKIDGVIGSGTRGSISQYKADNGMGYNGALDFEEEYQLVDSAKQKNDRNIDEAVASLKAISKPAQAPQSGKVINIQN
jgi:peptidoglycan hydrolase-like protein with peptidoglycan-binding domain